MLHDIFVFMFTLWNIVYKKCIKIKITIMITILNDRHEIYLGSLVKLLLTKQLIHVIKIKNI